MAEYHRFRDDPMMMLKRNLGFVYKYSFAWAFSYYFSKNKPDIDSDLPSFLPNIRHYDKEMHMHTELPTNLYQLVWKFAKWDILKVSALVVCKKFTDMLVISRMWNMSDKIKQGKGDLQLLIDTLPIIYFLDFCGIIFLSYAELLAQEIGTNLRAFLNLLVYRKILKYRLWYNKEFQEAMYVGFTQSDSVSITMLFDILRNYLEAIINVIIFAIWGGMYFGFPIAVLVSIFIIQQYITIRLVNSLTDIQARFLAAKGDRTKHTKSMLNVLPVSKIFGLEPLLYINVTLERIKEMGLFVNGAIKRSLITIINWSSVYTAFVLMLVVLLFMGQPIEYSFMVPMTKMLSLLFYTTGAIPKATESSINLKVAFWRIQRFIDMEEIEPIRAIKAEGEDEAPKVMRGPPILLQDCQFTWKRPPAPAPVQGAVELKPLKEDTTFKFNNVNLRVEKGELVAVIGKVGSGKSSLLMALFNEMELTNPKSSSKVVSDNCIYLAQRPWIINRSIKENIVLNHDFNEELFRISVDIASLGEEINKFDEKEEFMCGRRGEKLSGGQRWLIALARAYYQQ
jgi:ABC-type multidrug transport system fused ATPase/permease subunit